ncbi:MAG: membrane-bound lytic murein transglycosylase MltF [Alcanivoracaceae bacterium]|jgi:membrane-bound lytic murein transglycosylase F|nr:membrane-bound lytic murein transglycosylase MltF [Alcanivoracaceae bacterium]
MISALLRQSRHLLLPAALIGVVAALLAMRTVPSDLDRVLARGELIVVSRPSPSTWYQDQHGDTGFEYQLARAFADELGVTLRMVKADSLPALIDMVRNGQADIAAAALAITPERQERLRFTGSYMHNGDQLISRSGEARPASLADLEGRHIAVLAGSGQEESLRELIRHGQDLRFQAIHDVSTEKLLSLVDEGYFDLAIVDENSWRLTKALFPELTAGITLTERQLGWALRNSSDNSLYLAAQRFLTQRKADGTVAQLEKRFFHSAAQMNLYSSRSFLKHLDLRLPQYAEAFRSAGEESGFDWRLLAAMGYQESLWDANAVSPTGVRGLMMLTQHTAAEMGVSDRTDPLQSIRAGAAYLRKIYDRIPARIADPDRMWMAVAAYNVGFGHMEDARVLTQKQGGNPDAWDDVKKRLPLLRDANYYSDTRHGYARGGMQSVIYVRHIRQYYDLLVWASESNRHGPNMVAMLDSER